MNHVALFLLGEMRLFCKEGTWRQGLEGGLQSLTPLETMRTLWRCRACLASSTALHGRGCCGCSAGPSGPWPHPFCFWECWRSWPSADSSSGNGLSWREPPGSPKQFASRDMPRPTSLKVKQLCRLILPPERSLDPLRPDLLLLQPCDCWSQEGPQ